MIPATFNSVLTNAREILGPYYGEARAMVLALFVERILSPVEHMKLIADEMGGNWYVYPSAFQDTVVPEKYGYDPVLAAQAGMHFNLYLRMNLCSLSNESPEKTIVYGRFGLFIGRPDELLPTQNV